MATFNPSILKKPRWILAIVIGLLISVSFVRLAFWQLDRLDERREMNTTIEARSSGPARPLESILGQYGGDVDAMVFRRAIVEGTYMRDDELFSIGRTIHTQPATLVATPLALDDGTVLIVVRGFVPANTSGPPAEGYEPPGARVALVGRIDDGEDGARIGEPEPPDGVLRSLSRLDLEYIDQWMEGDVLPISLLLEEQVPSNLEGVPVQVPTEELSEGSHLGYAVQWFAFAIIVFVGVGALIHRAGTSEELSGTEQDRASQP